MDLSGTFKEILSGHDSKFDTSDKLTPPTDRSRIQDAVIEIAKKRIEQGSIDEEQEMKNVMGNPYQVVEQYQQALMNLRPKIIQKIKQDSPLMSQKVDVLGEHEEEIFTYIVEEEFVSGDQVWTVLAGAEPVRINVCDKLDYGGNEKELVKLVHEKTALDDFELTSYTINDEPLFIRRGTIR